LLLSVG